MSAGGSFISPLTLAERAMLLFLARHSIRASLENAAPPACPSLTPALTQPAAAFVSLHSERRLRGCIGTLEAERPLHVAVVRLAVSAAFDDPRFPPLAAVELPMLEIEISRLGPLVPCRPEDVLPGIHGVCVRHGEHRGVFLPQVATEHGWDRDTLLRELCRKAMLPPDVWKNPEAELRVFTAEVFGDRRAESY